MIIGIDIGGTTTKLVGYQNSAVQRRLMVKADDPLASAAGALGKYLKEEEMDLSDIRHIAVTGVGGGCVGDALFGKPVHHVGEFESIGRGGTFLAGCSRAIVVSIGTGTSIVDVDGDSINRWGGTGVGGGTVVGLSKQLLGMTDIFLISKLAGKGNLDRVDLTVGDISSVEIPGLPRSTTASNFGKCKDDATPEDQAYAILNMVYQTVGIIAHGAAKAKNRDRIVITGKIATLPQASRVFGGLSGLFDVDFTIPEYAAYATAIGAALFMGSADEASYG